MPMVIPPIVPGISTPDAVGMGMAGVGIGTAGVVVVGEIVVAVDGIDIGIVVVGLEGGSRVGGGLPYALVFPPLRLLEVRLMAFVGGNAGFVLTTGSASSPEEGRRCK